MVIKVATTNRSLRRNLETPSYALQGVTIGSPIYPPKNKTVSDKIRNFSSIYELNEFMKEVLAWSGASEKKKNEWTNKALAKVVQLSSNTGSLSFTPVGKDKMG